MNKFSLNTLDEGEKCTVGGMSIEGEARRRLRDLGMIDGTTVKCLRVGAGRKLAAYLIKGAEIAIRAEDAQKIEIIPCEEAEMSSETALSDRGIAVHGKSYRHSAAMSERG